LSGRASIGILVTDLNAMFVAVISMRVMEVPIMQVINVVLMLYRSMATIGTVVVIVTFVNGAFCHFLPRSS
jgi:hypothetical protein